MSRALLTFILAAQCHPACLKVDFSNVHIEIIKGLFIPLGHHPILRIKDCRAQVRSEFSDQEKEYVDQGNEDQQSGLAMTSISTEV